MDNTTEEAPPTGEPSASPPVPGAVVVFQDTAAVCRAVPLGGARLRVGRSEERCGLALPDDTLLSREHAELRLEKGGLRVLDLGSRNGTVVDGAALPPSANAKNPRTLRIGKAVVIPMLDIGRFARGGVVFDNKMVMGPDMKAVRHAITRAAKGAQHLLVVGESGTGKELAARLFHAEASKTRAPFVTVNCAALAPGIFESELFGSVKGAFTGATRRTGYFEAADGGTLFLDEIGELGLELQAKLLRVIETGEVYPVGSVTPRKVDVRLCAATNRDLALAASKGAFRPDLYYRLRQAVVRLPPLRERPEEIPFLVVLELRAISPALTATPALIEHCLLRSWPGNVRDLQSAVRAAALAAIDAESSAVDVAHMPPPEAALEVPLAGKAGEVMTEADERKTVLGAMHSSHGSIDGMASDLGIHRTSVYRLIDRYGLRDELKRSRKGRKRR